MMTAASLSRLAVGAALLLALVRGAAASTPVGEDHGLPDGWRSGEMPGPALFSDADLDPAVPSPETVLERPLGARPVLHAEVIACLEALAGASPHARLIHHGRTHEGRALVTLLVTSEQNMARLGEIRQALDRLSDPRLGDSPALEELPLCVWVGACVHGDELSGTEAALAAAHRIAAGRDALAAELRESLLLLIEPLQNPDGRDRAVHGWRSLAGRVPDADDQSLRHQGYWSRGRTNHYFFDLNRDWFLATQPETAGRLGVITAWHPQLLIDAHEMSGQSTFLFSPPREPYNPLVTPFHRRWWEAFAAERAAAFDREGWPYYHGEWHEEWYPGFATSWAAGAGALGLLYEQARTDGARVARTDGGVLTFRQSVRQQLAALMADLETASANRLDLMREIREQRERDLVEPEAAYVVLAGGQPGRARALVHALLAQGVEVYRADDAVSGLELSAYWCDAREKGSLPAGALVVPLRQPARRLTETLLAFDPQMDPEFLRSERRRLEREARSRLYDVSGWSLAGTCGLPVYRCDRLPWRTLERIEEADAATGGPGRLLRPETTCGFVLDGGDDRALEALVRLWDAGCTVQAALEPFTLDGRWFARGSLLVRRDLNRDLRPRSAADCAVGFGLPRPGEAPPPAYETAGADRLAETLARVAAATGVTIHGAGSGLAEAGIDLGSPRFRQLWPPRIAVAAGEAVDWGAYGSVAWLLDHQLGVAMSPLSVGFLQEADLTRYDVVVLPEAWQGPSGYARALGDEGLRRLRAWVHDGGTLIASGSAAAFLADSTSRLGSVRLRRQSLGSLAARAGRLAETAAPGVTALPRGDLDATSFAALRWARRPGPMDGLLEGGVQAYRRPEPFWSWAAGRGREEIEREDARLRLYQPRGALLRVTFDREHWLSAGCAVTSGLVDPPLGGTAPGEWAAARVETEYAFIADPPTPVVGAFAAEDSLRLGGLLWPEARERWARTAYLTREPIGRGQLVLFASEPCQRGTLAATRRAFLNAVLLGPGLGTTRRWPW